MLVPLYIQNPPDGEATFDQTEVFYSGDAYGAALATVDIDLTTRSKFGPGYTKHLHTTGSNYSYKVRFKNSGTGAVSGFSSIVPTGESYSIQETRRLLDDEVSASELFTDEDMQRAESRAVNRLFPRVLFEDKDTSLTISTTLIDYNLPVGFYQPVRVEKGTFAADNLAEIENYEILGGITLRLQESDIDEPLPITIRYTRAYRNVGEVPMVLQPFIIYEMLAECYETIANQRGVKFKSFQALQRENDITPERLKQLAANARQIAEEALSRVERG